MDFMALNMTTTVAEKEHTVASTNGTKITTVSSILGKKRLEA